MNYSIREMKQEDSTSVMEIFQQGINGGNATFDSTVPAWEVWNKKHFPHCRWVIVDEADYVKGWAALQPISSRICFKGVAEVSIYLDQSVQGKGLGKLLLHKLVIDSEAHHFWTLQSGIFPENHASIALHEKLGFRIVGIRNKLAQMNGIWRDVALLERRSELF